MIHNHEVGGSNPPLATQKGSDLSGPFFLFHLSESIQITINSIANHGIELFFSYLKPKNTRKTGYFTKNQVLILYLEFK